MKISWLNQNLHRCSQSDAVMLSAKEQIYRGTLTPEQNESLRAYSPEIADAIEQSAENLTPDPISAPNDAIGNKLRFEIAGEEEIHFHWQPTKEATEQNIQIAAGWESNGAGYRIRIYPGCDREDAKKAVAAIQKIGRGILHRGLATGETIEFHIGCPQQPGQNNVATSVNFLGKRVGLPLTKNNCHIMAVRADNLGIKLQTTLLHEIGHLFEDLLKTNLREIDRSLANQFHLAKSILQEISPHYLGQKAQDIDENLELLAAAIREKRKTITIGAETEGRKVGPEKYLSEWTEWLAQEMFAELLRHYYLEPCMTEILPTEEKSGWPELDRFIHRLRREAKINMDRTTAIEPLFAKKRQTPQF